MASATTRHGKCHNKTWHSGLSFKLDMSFKPVKAKHGQFPQSSASCLLSFFRPTHFHPIPHFIASCDAMIYTIQVDLTFHFHIFSHHHGRTVVTSSLSSCVCHPVVPSSAAERRGCLSPTSRIISMSTRYHMKTSI